MTVFCAIFELNSSICAKKDTVFSKKINKSGFIICQMCNKILAFDMNNFWPDRMIDFRSNRLEINLYGQDKLIATSIARVNFYFNTIMKLRFISWHL